MKKFTPLFYFLFVVSMLQAQAKFDYTWPLGYGGTYDVSPDYNGMLMHFAQSPPLIGQQTMLAKPIAFICDSSGNLRLYFNGCMLANGQHQIIENSDSIHLGVEFNNAPACEGGPMSGGYQNAIILPAPGASDFYYLFYLQKTDEPSYRFQLLYATIDMSQNGGAGKVILKNQIAQVNGSPIHLNTHITAVRHGNGRDWWIVCPTVSIFTRRLVLLLSPEGITRPYYGSDAGIPLSFNQGQNPAQIGFSADGQKYFRTIPNFGAEILDFNRCTGEFANIKVITTLHLNTGQDGSDVPYLGIVGSPNGRFLYVSTGFRLFQFDFWAADLIASKQLIGEFEGFESGIYPATFYQGVRGPDDKIYFGNDTRTKHLHVIHQPDLPGLECQFEQHDFPLPAYQSSIMPNFANYRLLDLPGSPCDTLGIDAVVAVEAPNVDADLLQVSPNPSTGLLQVYLPEGFRGGMMYVLNSAGQLIVSEKIQQEYAFPVEMRTQPIGLYWIILRDQEGRPVGYSKIVIDR